MATVKRRHGRSAGKPGQYQHECDICHSTFARAEHLSRHKRTVHSQEKKFQCDICGKTCSRSDNLRQHRKTHGPASKMDIGTEEEEDSEMGNYDRDDESESAESNWGDGQAVDTEVKNDRIVFTRPVRGRIINAAIKRTAERDVTMQTCGNDSNLTCNPADKRSEQGDVDLTAAGKSTAETEQRQLSI
ncbi:hypothetical protein FGG08_003526 [Glutinoglossum americanum]|uniref:C2H2-type domain-containing protein n=1 Tax=Glutinoglossum americanum TaxID=1670608 RepID=A0A9P8I754_9PEZI|nr:hypothetical protein FGG08_003526 [Glutinoglossum americanum]